MSIPPPNPVVKPAPAPAIAAEASRLFAWLKKLPIFTPKAANAPKPISPILILKIYVVILILSGMVLGWRMYSCKTDAFRAGIFDSEAHYVASRKLEPYHRLATGDFYPPPGIPDKLAIVLPEPKYLIGAYVLKAICMGKPIKFESLTTAPLIVAEPEKVLQLVPLAEQTQVLDWIDAGLTVLIQTPKGNFSAKVFGISCSSSKDRKTCSAIVQIDSSPEAYSDTTKWRLLPVEIKLQQPPGASPDRPATKTGTQGAK